MFDNKRIIIFDMDGTLIDSVGIWNEVDEYLIKSYNNVSVVDKENIAIERDSVLTNTKESDIYLSYVKYLKDRYSINEGIFEIQKFRNEIGIKYITEKVKLKDGVAEYLNYLKKEGYILVLATTTTRDCIDIYNSKNENTKKLGIYDIFDLVLTKEDVVKKKPDPEIYYNILKHFNVGPSECLVFEDTLHGVIAAKSAGIDVVGVYDKYSEHNKDEIIKAADHYIYNYKELM